MPPDEPPPLPQDLVGELTALAEVIAARDDHADLAARLEWLIDLLILRDQLPASFRPQRSLRGAVARRNELRTGVFAAGSDGGAVSWARRRLPQGDAPWSMTGHFDHSFR